MPIPPRPLPALDLDNRAFWTGGADGRLLIHQCGQCSHRVHPPASFCPRCESRDVGPSPVSGRGVVSTFTVNHKAWFPGLPVPYVLALVAIDEQEDVRLVSNIVNCPVEAVHIGMRVQVLFEQHDDVWLPLFEPEKPA